MADQPLFYADGLTVRARPVETRHGDGSSSSTMGFVVCACSDYVDGAAEEVAKALNRLPQAEALLADALAAIKSDHGATIRETADAIEKWMLAGG